MAQRTSTKAAATPARGSKAAKPARPKRRIATRSAKQADTTPIDKPAVQTGLLGGLVLAMLLGALGFLFSIFWVGAIVVMAVLLGTVVAEQRGAHTHGNRGVVTEVVEAVIDEVQDISDAASQLKA